jgi:hypothetical protein
MNEKDLIEKLAEHCHNNQWSLWMKYLFDKCMNKTGGYDLGGMELTYTASILPDDCLRWSRQMQTDYKDLSEEEKNSDRLEAENIIKFLKSKGYMIIEEKK